MRTAGKIRLLLALTIVAAIVALTVATLRRLPDARKPSANISQPSSSAELALKGMCFTETSLGSTKWTLVAERAEYDSTRSMVDLTGVRLNLMSNDKAVGELVLSSAHASYNTATREVNLRGGVKARSATGMEFTTATARFAAGQGMLTTSDPVRFSDGSLTVEGTGMDFSVATANLRVKSNVTATLKGAAAP